MAERTVVMFHGLGGDRNAMSSTARFCSRRLDNTEFVSIEGPLNLGTESSPVLGWFEPPDDSRREIHGLHRPSFDGLKESLDLVQGKIAEIIQRGVDPPSIHLLGHSQGGAMALAAGLTCPHPLGSVNTIAGYVALTSEMRPQASGTSYFLHHSTYDDNVSVRWAHYAKSLVESAGDPCTVRIWDLREIPHSIHVEQLEAICGSIARQSRSAPKGHDA